MKTLMLCLIFLCGVKALALGGCSGTTAPAATCDITNAGKVTAGVGTAYFCNGTLWKKIGTSNLGIACSEVGLRVVSGALQSCCLTTGTWFSVATANGGSCSATDTGKMAWTGTTMQVCDGTDWKQL